ncbi:hypothetical protein ACNHKD_00010 [Methylocystis sp. JAN1]|uniref:hypothetical protein n=1 Tax=Methylocystis sp. JAN1 TaxID=3397211 RepID=UPI003FA30EC5
MPVFKRLAFLVASAPALLGATAAKAGPNVPLCLSLQNSYNACMVQAQRQQGWGGYGHGWGDGYGGGWGDDDDYYRYQRRQQRGVAKQAECARWLYAIQQNGCVR